MKIKLPADLNKSIVEYLTTLPNINDKDTRRALIHGASLDTQLINLINFEISGTLQFSQQLVIDLVNYGQLQDGRNALDALLKASKQYVGVNRRQECELLLQEWQYFYQRQRTYIPQYDHDILVSYAFRDDLPTSSTDAGWITTFTEDLRKQLDLKLGGADRYSLCMACLDRQIDGKHVIETVTRWHNSAIVIVVLSQEYIDSYNHQQVKREIESVILERTQLQSTVFLIEREVIEEEHRPQEFCGLQSYRIIDAYSYTNKLNQIGLDLQEKLKKMRRGKISEEVIYDTLSKKPQKFQNIQK